MRKRTIASGPLLLLLGFLVPTAGAAGESTVVFGGADGWGASTVLTRLMYVPGRSGPDLTVERYTHQPGSDTELLLRFDSLPLSDASGNFSVRAERPELTSVTRSTGRGAYLVDGPEDRIVLTPGLHSAFQPGTQWGSFSIDFWLYPVVLSEGAAVLSWNAREGAADGFRRQSFAVAVRSGRLEARFDNFFLRPDGTGFTVELVNPERPIPRTWSHHTVRFFAETALLEYLVDGRPVAMTHVNDRGREDGSVFYPRIAATPEPGLIAADGFVGVLDELRVERRAVGDPELLRFPPEGGRVITSTMDLGAPGARLRSVTAIADASGLSDVLLYYHLDTERRDPLLLPEDSWTPVASGAAVEAAFGRFLTVRADLHPDTRSGEAPRLSELHLRYEPDPPPAPPTRVRATPLDGAVLLEWNAVHDPDAAGYVVYYGDRSGRYFGTESSLGRSPVDVGNVTSVVVPGLVNGTLYFFAVSAYDPGGATGDGVTNGELSAEAAARPARIHR